MRLPKDLSLIAKYIAADIYDRVGNAVAKDMVTAYNSAIRNFYDDYKPRVYRRKYRSYYFAHEGGTKGYVKFKEKNTDGTGFIVRMHITPDNIKVPYTSLTGNYFGARLNELVFNNTFVLGQHGGRLPLSILPEESRPKYPGDRWRAYKDIGWAWEPPVMEVPPKQQFDDWFDSYTTGGGIHKTVDKLVIHSINKILLAHQRQYAEKK